MFDFRLKWAQRIANKLNIETDLYLSKGEHDDNSSKAISELIKLLIIAKQYPTLPIEVSSLAKLIGIYLLAPILATIPKLIL
jgi:hypothetical protein